MYKFFVLAALVAVTKAGYIGAPAVSYAAAPAIGYAAPAITSQQSNILRSYGNLGQVSTYSKTIDTPYSSVRKSDVRVSNDALAYPAAPAVAAYAAPAIAAAPVAYRGAYAAPVAAAAPSLLGVAYSAAPAVAHISYSNGYGINYAY
ncbi:Cuticle protein 76 [Cryptotermes secundus]|uniref:Cuticle protein 76 n=1 Tax=Cryptotermes secundus TaxID=105785 RepID=A0A2J7QCF2_9NEOP|nr:Cuticle protein 76 [Cryptotermes secundus]